MGSGRSIRVRVWGVIGRGVGMGERGVRRGWGAVEARRLMREEVVLSAGDSSIAGGGGEAAWRRRGGESVREGRLEGGEAVLAR